MTTRNIWVAAESKPTNFAETLAISSLTATVLAQRGYTTPQAAQAFISPPPTPSTELPQLVQASERLRQAIKRREKILIWGDFDADGVAATTLLYEALKQLNADVVVHIPTIHGIQVAEYKKVALQHAPALLLLCDTGSSAFSFNDYAKKSDIETLAFDHHVLPLLPPDAITLVNPHALPATHPFNSLTAAGVVWLLITHLLESLNPANLELALLGLIADGTPLLQEARYLAQKGLPALQQTQRIGLTALMAVAGLDQAHLTVENIAFQLVPRLNAFGRLGDPTQAFQLLTTTNPGEATVLAAQADALNNRRKLLTRQMLKAIYEQLDQNSALLNSPALVLENPQWEGAVISAVAGQLAQEYRRPVALLIPGGNGVIRGSARAPAGFDLPAAFDQIKDILIGYGGHHSAVGFSLHHEQQPLFARRLTNALADQQASHAPDELLIEAELPLNQLDLTLVQDLEKLAPFGNGNPRPILAARHLKRFRSAKFGRDDQHRRLTLRDDGGADYTVFWWNSGHLPQPEGIIDLAYQVAPVYDNGEWHYQLTLVDWQQVEAPAVTVETPPELIDCRPNCDIPTLQAQEPELIIWAEGYSQAQSPGLPLSQLKVAPALLIYTAPPSPTVLEKALKKVHPERIYVHAALPSFDSAEKLLEALAALLRTAHKQFEGKITVAQLAERTAHTPETIKLALTAFELEWLDEATLRVKTSPATPASKIPALEKALRETAAYRRFLGRAPLENILP